MPAAGDQPDLVLIDASTEDRYEGRIDGELAAFVDYRLLRGRIALIHTEVLPAFAGTGVGRRFARAVLDDIRARGLKVTPICPFIAAYIERHPGYADLVSWGRERKA